MPKPSEHVSPDVDKHFRERESKLLMWRTGVYIRGVLPCTVCYFALAMQPVVDGLDHLRLPMLLFGSLSLGCVLMRHFASRCDVSDLKRRLQHAEMVCLVARSLMHCVCIFFDGDSSHIFLKLISLWFLPLSAAKESMTVESFQVYLGLHNILVLLRFWSDLQQNAAWVFGTLVVDRMLLDLSASRHEGHEMRDELARRNIEIEQLAEDTTKRLFQRFCDATATLSEDMHIAEPAPQLAAMLGINETTIKGRSFTSLIDSEDLPSFTSHVESIRCTHKDVDEAPADDVRPRVYDHFPESIQVKLLDAFAKPVPVHVFHASFIGLNDKRVYFVGLSETWRPPKTKGKKDCGKMRSGTSAGCSPSGTGSLLPPGSLMPQASRADGPLGLGNSIPNPMRRRGNSPRAVSPRPKAGLHVGDPKARAPIIGD